MNPAPEAKSRAHLLCGGRKDFLPHLYVSDFQFLSDRNLISERLKNSWCLGHNGYATIISQCFAEARTLVQVHWQSARTWLFVGFVRIGRRNWVRLLFCNICKPCNWLLALKQEKYHSNSCFSYI